MNSTEDINLPEKHIGGIRTLRDMEIRCRCEDEHWIWKQQVMGKSTPIANYGKTKVAARRLAWILAGKKLRADQVVVGTCPEQLCINPSCSKATSRAGSAKVATALGRHSTKAKLMASAQNGRDTRKLTDEQAMSVLLDPRQPVEIARELGVSRQLIQAIKTRRRYRDLVVPGDVFSLAASGLFTGLIASNDGTRRAA